MTGAATRPRVDVGIVTWNTRDITTAAVRRLLADDSGCSLRIMVRDHASSDHTAEALEALPGVEVERCPHNPGFAAGVNALLARSSAPWFLALNSDAWPEPGALRRLVSALERYPRAAVVSPALRRPDGRAEPAALPFPRLGRAAAAVLGPPSLAQPVTLSEVDWVVGAAPLFRRAAVEAVGGLDETFHMYAEDLEWCWRARRAGWTVLLEPAAVVVHVGGASGAQAYGERRSVMVARSTDTFLRRTRGPLFARAYGLAAAAGAARAYAVARRRRQPDLAAHWRREARAVLWGGR